MYLQFADQLEIAWQQPSYTVSETAASIEVCVGLTGELERSVVVTISTASGTANAGKLASVSSQCMY